MSDDKYKNMLDRLYMSLPSHEMKETSRMEIPKVDSIMQGQKTLFRNFSQIIKLINRDESKLSKFITKDLAAAGTIIEGKLILNGSFTTEKLQKSLDAYLKEYLYCKQCGRPDTKFETHSGVKMLKCTACGAVLPVRQSI